MKPVSGITQTGNSYPFQAERSCVTTFPLGCNSHQSSSGPTMSSVQSNFMASNFLTINSKNEDTNPGHDPFCSSLGKRVLHGTPNENKHGAIIQEGRDSIESMPYIGSGLRQPNSNHHIFSNIQYHHPLNHLCSIQSSPTHFRTPLCGHEDEFLPHNINENSNHSFETYQTEEIDSEKISEGHCQIQSGPITGWEMPFFSTIEYVNHPTTILQCVSQSMILG